MTLTASPIFKASEPVAWGGMFTTTSARVKAVQIFEELAIVRLRHSLPELGLRESESGTVVHVYDGGEGYEVEFARGHNPPVVATLTGEDLQ